MTEVDLFFCHLDLVMEMISFFPFCCFLVLDLHNKVREGRKPGKSAEVENSDMTVSEVMLMVQVLILLSCSLNFRLSVCWFQSTTLMLLFFMGKLKMNWFMLFLALENIVSPSHNKTGQKTYSLCIYESRLALICFFDTNV